jgi:hypothetical protein
MTRPRAPSKAAVIRALKAAAEAGLRVTGFKVDVHSGKIEVETDKPEAQASSPLDTWMEKHAREAEGH